MNRESALKIGRFFVFVLRNVRLGISDVGSAKVDTILVLSYNTNMER
ncbi:hypothetical protein [Diplocloster agilis]|nr:hypothetical protein [Diplocloster agilis]